MLRKAALALVTAALLWADASAATFFASVPKVENDPPLDPRASLSAWAGSAQLTLTWDVIHVRSVPDPATVHLATDGKYLYVRFDARQRQPIVAAQHSDDVIAGGSVNNQGGIAWNDDAVWVDLWPTGPGGFEYQFESNPDGSHNESSTENTAFAPHWESRGVIHGDAYTVTMAIPLDLIHGARAGTWRAQFVRYVVSTGDEEVWSYDPAQARPDDVSHAGALAMPLVDVRAAVAKPRLAVYGLGAVATRQASGSTSRVGADLSVPITPTAAFFTTFHPDYSNVELDQQSISPTVYQRVYTEVRPFFTQAASYYNNFDCNVCSGYRTTLYTPAIPTPTQGYAFEGKQGDFGLAAFDAIGHRRTDLAGALNYVSSDDHWHASYQHVTADLPGIVDDANQIGVNWSSRKYLSGYVNYSTDTGTLVLDPSRAGAIDAGGGWGSQDFALFGSVRKVGRYFNPVDGFNAHPDIAGYGLYSAKIWNFAPQSKLAAVGISGFLDRYQGTNYGQSQSDDQVLVDVLTKSAWDLQLYSGSDYWRFGQTLAPISQSAGFTITYHSGLQNNTGNFPSHGSSATPTQIQYYTGRYGAGRLDTWLRTSTVRIGLRGLLTFTLDDTSQRLHNAGPDNIQWFDGIAYAYQISPSSSLAIGLRRVAGCPPQPNGGGNCEGSCSNVSIAYHLRMHSTELYAAYGDPNTLTTVPQAIFKLVFYAGGQKGT
jgi:hypothetical protein